MVERPALADRPGRRDSERRQARSSDRRGSSRLRHRRLRTLYFALASVWGFLAGTTGVVVSMAAGGRPLGFGPRVGTVLAASTVIAVLGGLIAARAYRDATTRR